MPHITHYAFVRLLALDFLYGKTIAIVQVRTGKSPYTLPHKKEREKETPRLSMSRNILHVYNPITGNCPSRY